MDDLEKSFADIKKVYEPRLFKYEALIAFWFALHLQKLDFVQMLSKQDVIIEKVVENIWTLGAEALEEKRLRDEEEKKQNRPGMLKSLLGRVSPGKESP